MVAGAGLSTQSSVAAASPSSMSTRRPQQTRTHRAAHGVSDRGQPECSGLGAPASAPAGGARQHQPEGTSACSARHVQHRRRAAPLSALQLLLAALLAVLAGIPCGPLVRLASASSLTGTAFPFEGCWQEQRNSPYFATVYSYREFPETQSSRFCIEVHALGTCIPGGRRCCDTAINKIKFFPSLGCRGSIESVLVNGNTIQSFTFELHDGFDILKVTPLSQWMPNPVDANHTIVCLNLRPPCWTARMLSYSGNNNRMEYALYDRKKDNYECCPVGIMDVPAGSTVPNFPPLPPPLGGGGGKRASPPPNGEIRRQPPPPRVKKQRSPSPPPAPSTPPSPPPPMPSTPPPPPRWWKPPPPSPAAKLTPKQGLKKRPPPPAGGKRSPRPPPPLNPSLPPPSPPPSVVPKKSPPPLPPPSPPPPVVGKASPPPPSPPPVVVGPGCRITVTMRRLVEVEPAFIDANCALLGAFVLLPLGSLGGVGYSCAFSSRTNVVITISGVPGADVRSLLGTYRDQPDAVGNAVAALGLSTCGQDSAVLSSPCAPNLSGTILSCSATDPVPAKSSPPPPPRPPPPRPPPSPPPPTIQATSPPPPPPDSTPVTQWTLYQDSVVFLLYFQAGTWADGEKACAQMGGHLASVKDKGEYDFLVSFVQEYMPASGSLNAWFGLTTTTNAAGAAYTGANSDGSRMAFTPSSFAWDRTRNAVRNYMFSCSKATGACSWTYGASAVEKQPAFLCRF